jgi:hypothetical protein
VRLGRIPTVDHDALFLFVPLRRFRSDGARVGIILGRNRAGVRNDPFFQRVGIAGFGREGSGQRKRGEESCGEEAGFHANKGSELE